MDLQTISNLLAASASAHAVHAFFESFTVKSKVKRLVAILDKTDPPKIPEGMDTRPKALGVQAAIITTQFGLAYLVVSLIDPSLRGAAVYVLFLLLGLELLNTFSFHRYHEEIEKVTKRFK
jgi:hypothetical protein